MSTGRQGGVGLSMAGVGQDEGLCPRGCLQQASWGFTSKKALTCVLKLVSGESVCFLWSPLTYGPASVLLMAPGRREMAFEKEAPRVREGM